MPSSSTNAPQPHSLRRARALLFIAAALAVPLGACSRRPAPPTFPNANLIVISIDTLRRDALGIYGAPAGASPNLDALAKESVVFDQAISATNQTAPSHTTMLTGVSARVHGVLNTRADALPRRIPSALPTLAERLKDLGYATAGESGTGYVCKTFGFHRGFEAWTEEYSPIGRKGSRVLEWTERRARDKPFFAFLHTYEVHAPYIPESPKAMAEVMDRHRKSVIPRRLNDIRKSGDPFRKGHEILFADNSKFTTEDLDCLRDLYATCVRQMDRGVGAFVEELRKRGILDKSILVLTSDHGEEFREHGRLQHETIYESIIRVPMIVRLPGGIGGGTRVGTSFPSVSLLATLFDLLGLPAPSGIEGRSLASTFAGDTAEGPLAFSVLCGSDDWLEMSVRSPSHKLIETARATGTRSFWFDLVNDPEEKKARPGRTDPEAQPFRQELKTACNVWQAMSDKIGKPELAEEMSAELRSQLEALGYVK